MEQSVYLETKRGKPALVYAGRTFRLKQVHKNKNKRWICRTAGCYGSVITDEEDRVLKEGSHSCIPDVAKVEVQKCVMECKKRCREELTPVPRVFSETFSRALDCGLDFVTEMPEFRSVKTSLYRNRHNALGFSSLPDSREDIVLPNMYTEDFLLIDEGSKNRILAFASESGKRSLQEHECYFGDGTFKSCCRQFQQLYTIHVDIGSTKEATNIVPAVYALLPDKAQITYERLLLSLKQNLPLWSPKAWKVDFESAMIQAIRKVFPDSVVKGCNFHYNQCLWRKVEELGLVSHYRDNEEVRRHIRMCAALAHIPPKEIANGWLSIMEKAPTLESVGRFNDYMVDQWLDNDTLGDTWNCYNERHRTTNAVEAWHNKLNKDIRKSHPNILELIANLKNDARYYDVLRCKAELNIPPKKRLKKYAALDETIKKTVNDFVTGKTSIAHCLCTLSYVVHL